MTQGFKILDAYVEVHAKAEGVAKEAAEQLRASGSVLATAGGGLGSALMGGMQGVVGGLVGGVTASLTAPLVNGVNTAIAAVTTTAKEAIFDYNSKLEQANIGFTTMLGSAEKAKSFLGELQKFAASTPFEFSDLTLASQRLIAMGINAKDVIPTMTAIGDAVAGLGGDKGTIDQLTLAIGQMSAKTKVQGDEILQLTEAGVPALKILASAYGVSVPQLNKMISANKIMSKDAIPALVAGLEKGTKTTTAFGGMMEKQSKTMVGSLSNISDSVNQTVSHAFLPMFKMVERLTGQLAKFTGSSEFTHYMERMGRTVTSWMSKIGAAFNSVVGDRKVQSAFDDLGGAIDTAMSKVGPALDRILPKLTTFLNDVLPSLLSGVQTLIDKMPQLIDSFDRWSDTLVKIAPAISSLVSFLSGVVGTINDLAVATSNLGAAFWSTGLSGNYAHLGGASGPGSSGGGKAWLASGGFGGAGTTNSAVTSDKAAASLMGQALKKARFGGGGGGGGWTPPAIAGGGSGGGGGSTAKPPSLESIYKVFETYGKQVAAGLQKGLLGSTDQIKTAAGAMRDAVKKAFDNDYLSKGRENSMLAEVTKVTNKLIAESKRRASVVTQLAAANDKLKGLKSDRASMVSSISDGVIGAGAIGDLFEAATSTTTSSTAAFGSLDGRGYQASYTTSTTTTTPGGLGGVRAKLRTLLANTKEFTTNLKTLVKNGLDRFTVQELFQAGATAGLPITKELLADKSSFNDIVSLQKQLNTAAGVLGEFAGATTYDANIGSATATVNRLRDRRDNITAVMIVEARKIDEVDKVVKAVNALAKTAKAKKAGAKK